LSIEKAGANTIESFIIDVVGVEVPVDEVEEEEEEEDKSTTKILVPAETTIPCCTGLVIRTWKERPSSL
jgi:hypothetical protein